MSTRRSTRTSSATNMSSSVSRTESSTSQRRSRRHDSAMDEEEHTNEEQHEEKGDDEQQEKEEEEEEEGEEEEEQQQDEDDAASQDGGEDVPASATTPRAGRSSRASFLDTSNVDMLEDTPTRLTRLDEKSELQGLNKRLEFYILKQRERDASADAWGRELSNLKLKHASDLEHQKNLFENQLGLVRKNRDELSAKLSKLEGENAHKDNLLSELQARITSEHKARSSLETRVDSVSKELMQSQNAVHALQQQVSNLQHEYDALKTSHDDLEKSLDAARAAGEAASSRANKLQQQYSDLSAEYDTLQARHAQDAKKYDAQIHQLCVESSKSQETLLHESGQRLDRLFAERQAQFDKDKAESLAELKSSYDAKLYGYRSKLEELGHELEQEKSGHRSAARNLERELKYSDSLRNECQILQQRVTSLEKALEAEKQNPDLLKQLQEKIEAIKRIKMAFKRKDAEFDELMDVKIMLDLEIKGYRALLDQEDARLGAMNATQTGPLTTTSSTTRSSSFSMTAHEEETHESSEESNDAADTTSTEEQQTAEQEQPTSKKRRRASSIGRTSSRRKSTRGSAASGEDSNSAASTSSSSSSKRDAAVLFSRHDGANGAYIGMTNNSGTTASLQNWCLRAVRQNVTYHFPVDAKLPTGATFYVHASGKPAPREVDEARGDLVGVWPETVEFSSEGDDEVELLAPSGGVAASVVIAAAASEMDVDEDDSAASKAKKQKQDGCVVM